MFNHFVWYQDDDFTLSLEPYKDIVCLHMDVKHWSKTVIGRMFEILQEIELEMAKLGFSYLLMYNPDQCRSWIKLVTKYAKGKFIGVMKEGFNVYGKDLKCLSV